MAQLELANFSLANGTAALAVTAGTALEVDGRAVAQSSSFNRLLQAGTAEDPIGLPMSPVVEGATPATVNLQALQPNLASVDPAGPGQAGAGQQLVVAALAVRITPATGESEPGESEGTATEIGASDDADATAGETPAGVPWLGLPLVMDARAALRNAGSSGIELSSPSGVPAAADSMDSTRLQLILRATSTPSQMADGGRGSARLAGDPMAGTLGGGLPPTARAATEKAGGLPPPMMDSTVGAASDDAVSMPSNGSAVSLVEGLKTPVARPADSQPQSGLAATGVATLTPAGVAMVAGVEEATAVGGRGETVPRSDALSAGPLTTASVHAAHPAAATAEAERVAADRAGVASDPQSAQPVSGRPFQWYPRLAESFARTGSEPLAGDQSVSAGNAVPVDEVPLAAVAAGVKIVSEADRPLSPADPDLSSLVTSVQAYRRSADTVAISATLRSAEAFQDAAAIRADEPTAPATGGTLTQAGPSSPSPARPEAGAVPASPPTAPDVLNLQQKNWERTLGHQLNWMVNNRLQEAEIKVNPPDLGPLEVRVSLHHNQTNVTFFSHEAAVREAIESALPRLREMLDGQGINLNQAQVSDQSLARQQAGTGEQPSSGQRDGRLPTTAPAPEIAEKVAESRPRSRGPLGTVDDYA